MVEEKNMTHGKQFPETRSIQPKILYYGTPVVLLTTLNEDETSKVTPMSSAWALGDRIMLGLGEELGKTFRTEV